MVIFVEAGYLIEDYRIYILSIFLKILALVISLGVDGMIKMLKNKTLHRLLML